MAAEKSSENSNDKSKGAGDSKNAGALDKGAFFSDLLSSLKKNKVLVAIIIALTIFGGLLEDVLTGDIMRLDTYAYQLFVVTLRSDALTPLMEGFSSLGSPIVVIVMAAILAAFAPGRRPGYCVAINVVCALALNQLLKNLIQRPRPDGFRLVAETGYSFPSGHSMISMAFFGLIVWMIWHYEHDRVQRYGWSIFFSIIILCIGVSRIYLGVHYASDVLAGFCVSFLWLVFYTRVVVPPLMRMPEPIKAQDSPRFNDR
ncbi:MAG: phosphatase PAP2 family protein [Tractidigestivibacter sp.]|uniref:phosphatase PAP2 family protein n=1 Tax=Tractidigestivibacter sp. TaxID=2847320 RepID=UPI003D907769